MLECCMISSTEQGGKWSKYLRNLCLECLLILSSLTQSFPSESSPGVDASILQQRLQALSTLHNQTSAELATKESEYNALHARLTQLSIDSQHTNRELAKQLTEMRNEARWAKEALALAERKEVLARQEIESLRSASDVSIVPMGVESSG